MHVRLCHIIHNQPLPNSIINISENWKLRFHSPTSGLIIEKVIKVISSTTIPFINRIEMHTTRGYLLKYKIHYLWVQWKYIFCWKDLFWFHRIELRFLPTIAAPQWDKRTICLLKLTSMVSFRYCGTMCLDLPFGESCLFD